ncbi:MAG: acyl--CoA ligase [Clostridia bacterium]|nr:acyl--CoA ligase [Clostridia bacterium]
MIKYSLECLDKINREHSFKNIFDILCSHGDRPALEFKIDKEIKIVTFRQMEFVVEYVADKIKANYNFPANSFVGIHLENCPEWIVIYWAILMAGYRPFFIDYRLMPEKTRYYLEQTRAAAVITGNHTGDVFYEGTDTIDAYVLLSRDHKELYKVATETVKEGTLPQRISEYEWADEMALCTSGTTGDAKIYTYDGTAISYQLMSARPVIMANERISSDRTMKNLAFLPLHHIFGFMACYLWYSFFAGSLVFVEKIAPSVLFAACKEHKVTHILAVPLLVNSIVKGVNRQLSEQPEYKRKMFKILCDVSIFLQRINPEWGIKVAKKIFKNLVLDKLAGTSVEVIICGGGHVLPDCMRTINAMGYYTLCGFGMTEVGISSLEYRKSVDKRIAGCVGIPVTAIEYKIVPADESNPNVGELFIRGKFIHSGRVKDGEVLPPDTDSDGWFTTGDIGRLEDDALYIEGRVKDVIINESGENVYPDELEDYFGDIDGVSQFTVMGVKNKPEDKYESITLVIRTEREITEEFKSYILDQVANRCDKLPFNKKINTVVATNMDLPVSSSGKIKRLEIKKQLENNSDEYILLKGRNMQINKVLKR